jgi:hypothetical protein
LLSYDLIKNLKDNSLQADYVAITAPIFSSSVQDYTSFISTNFDVNSYTVFTNQIYDQFSYGYPYPEAIKGFLQNTLVNWQTPKPSYVNLIGDANYDAKGILAQITGVELSKNYVPSYGFPVGDNWFAIFDEILPLPQFKLGRIPILNDSQLHFYKSKLENNLSSPFDEWNKKYLIFSGGLTSKPNEMQQIKAANDSVALNVVKPPPIAGNFHHFYKTINPPSDFGPFTPAPVSSAISAGGLFISYIGHSGTATWDNGINNIQQLKNNVNRNPLITDFGCSTNKFAEPDIICFGERFLLDNNGQALGYVGNSSLGFLSTAVSVPRLFYRNLLITDSLNEIGSAHLNAKFQLFNNFGNSDVNKIFSYSNILLGDPIVRMRIPPKPNLTINNNDFLIENTQVPQDADSIQIGIIVRNLGLAANDSLYIKINHKVNDIFLDSLSYRIKLPDYQDTLYYWAKIKNFTGQHYLNVNLDMLNEIDEIYEDDNQWTFNFTVYSTQLRDFAYDFENSYLTSIKLLNPIRYSNDILNIKFQLFDNPDLLNPQIYNISADTFSTYVGFTDLSPGKRYWYNYKIDDQSSEFNKEKSFYTETDFKYFLKDSISYSNQIFQNTIYDSNGIKISSESINISVLSAGWYAGSTCVIAKNGINLLSNSYFAGMGIVVFDPVTMSVDTSTWFTLFGNPTNVQALADLVNSIPEGKIVAMGVADDARNNMSANLRTAIKTLGSTKIDSLLFRGSWAIIGRKGAAPGDCIEEVKSPYDGSILIDTFYTIPNSEGLLITKEIGPALSWENLNTVYFKPADSEIIFTPL